MASDVAGGDLGAQAADADISHICNQHANQNPRRLGTGRQFRIENFHICSRGRSILDTVWDHQF
jgi:hypothetical protein